VIDDPRLFPAPKRRIDLPAPRSGVVQSLLARPIGHATMLLGAGRAKVASVIDPAVGVILHKKIGDNVTHGEPLCTLLVNDESALDKARSMILGAYTIGDQPVSPEPLIVERLAP
jgi:thymidine phosphorylase